MLFAHFMRLSPVSPKDSTGHSTVSSLYILSLIHICLASPMRWRTGPCASQSAIGPRRRRLIISSIRSKLSSPARGISPHSGRISRRGAKRLPYKPVYLSLIHISVPAISLTHKNSWKPISVSSCFYIAQVAAPCQTSWITGRIIGLRLVRP